MKKNIYILLISIATMSACKKPRSGQISVTSGSDAPMNGKYLCVCNTSITYVDHCGEADNFIDTSYIQSKNSILANSICKQTSTTSSDNYTITTTICEIK